MVHRSLQAYSDIYKYTPEYLRVACGMSVSSILTKNTSLLSVLSTKQNKLPCTLVEFKMKQDLLRLNCRDTILMAERSNWRRSTLHLLPPSKNHG